MKAGQHVLMMLPLMNRDPRQFDDPDLFKLDRIQNRHVALGLGVHRCIGTYYVRVELSVALREFLQRIQHFELDPSDRAEWRQGQLMGMRKVPIVFPRGGGYPDEAWRPIGAAAAV